jgi:tetratricopeptide (TPR) repeat protein
LDQKPCMALDGKEERGGVIGQKGYGFQAAYIVSRIPIWLEDPDFIQFLQEGAGDVDVRFNRDDGEERWYVQVKNYQVKPAKAREVFQQFNKTDTGTPSTYTRFTLACPGLNPDLKRLRSAVEDLRGVAEFFGQDEHEIMRNTWNNLESLVAELKLQVDATFLVNKVYFDTDLAGLTDDTSLCDLFVGRLVRLPAWARVTPAGAADAYARLALLSHRAIRETCTRERVEAIIREATGEMYESSARELEKDGDRSWEQALWAGTYKDSLEFWSKARDVYQEGLKELPDQQRSLTAARLHRKIAACFRKRGQLHRAEEHLRKGRGIVRTLGGRAVNVALEGSHLDLERAYLYLNRQDWTLQLRAAEDIIETEESFRGEPLYQQPEAQCLLGYAYNLLGIALDASPGLGLGRQANPEDCWERAEEHFKSAKNNEGKRAILDVRINRAERSLRIGHCDPAIEILTGLLDQELPPQRVLLVWDNLATAYLDRLRNNDLDHAVKLAQDSLEFAKETRDSYEKVWALKIRLKAMKEEISAADEKQRASILDDACDLYGQGLTLVKSADSNEELEMKRLMGEIYLEARETEKAAKEIEFVKEFTLSGGWEPRTEWEDGDVSLTLARYHRSKGQWAEALSRLDHAYTHFSRGGHLGMMVDTSIEQVRTYILQRDWKKARSSLNRALAISRQLKCQARINRVKSLETEIPKGLAALVQFRWVSTVLKVWRKRGGRR